MNKHAINAEATRPDAPGEWPMCLYCGTETYNRAGDPPGVMRERFSRQPHACVGLQRARRRRQIHARPDGGVA